LLPSGYKSAAKAVAAVGGRRVARINTLKIK
jgi:hypothetical protein